MNNLRKLIKNTITEILSERKLTYAEKNKKEDIVKGMKKTFKGDKSSIYAIATDKAKKVGVEEGLGDGEYYKAIYAADSKLSPMNSISSVKTFLKNKFKNLSNNDVDYLAKEWAKKVGLGESQEMDESLIHRWQYYAGIK